MAKTINTIAKTLIAVGVFVLGFMSYQLWGTSIQHSLAQSGLEDSFEDLLAETEEVGTATFVDAGDEGVIQINSISQTGVFPETAEFAFSDSVVESLPLLYRNQGDAIAKITIQRIGLNEIVVEGTDVDDLKKGPGHYGRTPLPGQPGNVSIAGHRTTYGAPFADIHKLDVGDSIIVSTIQGVFEYKVVDIGDGDKPYKIVSPNQSSELSNKGANHLTLTSCHPRFSAAQRIIVRAELVGDPVVALPRPQQIGAGEGDGLASGATSNLSTASFGTGLNGDKSSVPSLILWAAAGLAVMAAAYLWGKRWKKWRTYWISSVPLLLVIFSVFFYIDRILPSY